MKAGLQAVQVHALYLCTAFLSNVLFPADANVSQLHQSLSTSAMWGCRQPRQGGVKLAVEMVFMIKSGIADICFFIFRKLFSLTAGMVAMGVWVFLFLPKCQVVVYQGKYATTHSGLLVTLTISIYIYLSLSLSFFWYYLFTQIGQSR